MKASYLFLLLIPLICCTSEKPKKRIVELQEVEYQLPYQFKKEIEREFNSDTTPYRFQKAAAEYAAKGDYRNALRTWDLGMPGSENTYSEGKIDSLKQQYEVRNASEYIVEAAKDEQVLIINEAHHNSSHRFFTKSLLQGLYDHGYRYFGLEALSPGKWMDSSLNARQYPVQATGYYTKDPQFGDLLRKAMQIGFELFPYEDTTRANGKFREIGQAKQISDMIRKHPEGKFLIHCGFAHAYEGPYAAWEKTMAGRLKEFTQIDPLTVSQTGYSERGDSTYNHPLLKALRPTTPSVLVNRETKEVFGYEWKTNYTDITVLHPISTYQSGRPEWLFAQGNLKQELTLPEHKLKYPLMIMAFKVEEDIQQALPLDIVEADSIDKKVSLALPNGAYSILMVDGENAVAFDHKFE